jgi:pimeloyl-ACP methyl ester carboxylesterase
MRKIYFISGLGADERVFQKLHLANYDKIFIQWILPNKNESMENYSKRLSVQIIEKNPIIIGISFGGMMAIEISKHIPSSEIIIISSAKTKFEIPFYYKVVGFLKLDKILPFQLFKKSNFLTYWMFDVHETENKILLKDILKRTDTFFLKWAINQIVNWKNNSVSENITHIHGTSDKILPYCFIKNPKVIKNGGHLIILDYTTEIEVIISQVVSRK